MTIRCFMAKAPTFVAAVLMASTGPVPAMAEPVDTPPVVSAPGNEISREKLIFLFHHRPEWSREHFHLHYVETHAPLGLRHTRNLLGYTVDLVRTPHHVDAITEQWVPTAADMLDATKSYPSPEELAKVTVDRISDGQTPIYVVQERILRDDNRAASPLFRPTPGIKAVWFFADATKAPPPPASAYRVVDNLVSAKLVSADKPAGSVWWREVPSDFALIRMAWADSLADFGPADLIDQALITTEYRFRAYTPGRKAGD